MLDSNFAKRLFNNGILIQKNGLARTFKTIEK
jgi:hypothetical protein